MPARPWLPGDFGYPAGLLLGAAATALTVATGATAHPASSLVALIVVIDIVAVLSTADAALATAAVCWFLHSGFVLGRHGALVFTSASGHAALTFLANALLVSAVVAVLRGLRRQARR